MQLLFEKGFEFKETEGLGLIPGQVIQIDSKGLKIPHMGWNDLRVLNPCVVTEDMKKNPMCISSILSGQKQKMKTYPAIRFMERGSRLWYTGGWSTALSSIRRKAERQD